MKVGFVAVVGRPNVGKSSLLNEIIDFKLSITTATPQTTRNKIKAIYNDDESQIIFLDTPGIHKPKQKLGEFLNKAAYSALKDSDVNLFLTPINEPLGPGDKLIIEKLDKSKTITIMTKIDLGNLESGTEKIKELKANGLIDVISVSIKKEDSIKALINYIKDKLEEGEPFFDREDITDVPMRFIAQEIIRESAIDNTKEEVPHAISVQIEDFIEEEDITINAIIYVERNSQKGILIGKDGTMIKTIGVASRKKLIAMVNKNVHLRLKVKVDKDWTNDEKRIVKRGY